MYYQKELTVGKKIAVEAGNIMLRYFEGDQKIKYKNDGSPVTIADTEINSFVIKHLNKEFPNDGVIGEEESTSNYGMGRKWLCDPIDGTKAFTWGLPTSTFSLGLVLDGKPIVGVVYDPYLKKMYTGVKGQGSFCNGKRLSVSKYNLTIGFVAVSSSARKIASGISYINALIDSGVRTVTFSGAIYKAMLVARGRISAYIEEGISGHDTAAAEVIVKEAGGKVTNLFGEELDYTKPFDGALFSNGIVHSEILKMV